MLKILGDTVGGIFDPTVNKSQCFVVWPFALHPEPQITMLLFILKSHFRELHLTNFNFEIRGAGRGLDIDCRVKDSVLCQNGSRAAAIVLISVNGFR